MVVQSVEHWTCNQRDRGLDSWLGTTAQYI